MTAAESGATGAEQTASAQATPVTPMGKPLTSQPPDSGIGGSYVGPAGITALAAVIIVATILAVYSLVALWPPNGAGAAPVASHLFGIRLLLDRDQQLFVVVALAGAIGGLIHSGRSMYWYVGNRALRRSWLLMYLTLPFVGSALAVIFYIILRGGLITGAATAQVNLFGFTAIAALVGLFSSQAAEKLRLIFSTLLAPAETGRDSVTPRGAPAAEGVEPVSAAVGKIITIHGKNLSECTAVLFEGATAPVTAASAETAIARVPPGASAGPIRLIVGDRIVNVPGEFRVEL